MQAIRRGSEQCRGDGRQERQRENIGSGSCGKEYGEMKKGRYGIHGGQYIPETLMNAVTELEEAYEYYKKDPQFNAELTELLMNTREDRPDCTLPGG